jgi:hypothetical protein
MSDDPTGIFFDDLYKLPQASDQCKKVVVDPMYCEKKTIAHPRSCLHESSLIIVEGDQINEEGHSDLPGSHSQDL